MALTFTAGNYLGGEYSVAYDVIAKFFEGVTNEKSAKTAEEKHAESELILFQSRCLEKQNKFDDALIHLRSQQSKLVDGLSFRVKQAELLVLSGRFNEGKIMWNLLVQDQGENYRFHSGFQAAVLHLDTEKSKIAFQLKQLELPSTNMILSDGQKDTLTAAYTENCQKFKSKAYSKICLTFARGENFKILLTQHIRQSLHDEYPALYQDIFTLIRDSEGKILKDPVDFRVNPVALLAIEIVNRFVENLKLNSFGDEEHSSGSSEERSSGECSVEAPGVYLWGMFLQCHLHVRCGDISKAMSLVDRCLQHTPTALDMFSMKARLLKKSGDVVEASVVMDYCRSLGKIR